MLGNIKDLLFLADVDTIGIPILSMKIISKIEGASIESIAEESSSHLLELFLRLHDRGQVGGDLLEIFKIWSTLPACVDLFS